MLRNFPGLLFYTDSYTLLEAIHADWPIYPTGHGWHLALRSLANFAQGTKFYQIDDIDKCLLFTISDPNVLKSKGEDIYGKNLYHVAIWHEDLIELSARGLAVGVTSISDFEFSIRKFNTVKESLGPDNYIEDEDGNLQIKTKNGGFIVYNIPIDTSSEDWQEPKDFVFLPDKTIELTPAAFNTLTSTVGEGVHPDIFAKAAPLLALNFFDTAIREAVLLIEHSIKTVHNTDQYGQKLIDLHIKKILELDKFKTSFIKCYRGELRTLTKYVRNDYMHNQKNIDEDECSILLYRINDVYHWFLHIKEELIPN
ncbi:MAG TPA: hypothetical protein VD884_13100 [Ohtaekwangia sp.]|nr:hypothetical protein [Ohtaekwangia sp.]